MIRNPQSHTRASANGSRRFIVEHEERATCENNLVVFTLPESQSSGNNERQRRDQKERKKICQEKKKIGTTNVEINNIQSGEARWRVP